MADLKISELTVAGSLTGAELVPLVQSGGNRRATLDTVSAYAREIPQTTPELSAAVTPSDREFEPYRARRYGAAGDDSTNDAPAGQVMADIDVGYANFEPAFTYKFRPTNTAQYYFGNLTNTNVYTGVLLSGSNHTVDGVGSTFHIASRSGIAGSVDYQYCYATPKNMTMGTQKHLTFFGTTVNTENDSDSVNSNHRGYNFVGVDGARLLNCKGLSSGNRRGTGGNFQNCKNVQISGHFTYKNTQGFTFRFSENMCITGGVWYDASELLDFDGTQKRAVVVGNTFESTSRVNQMVDFNGQVDAVLSGFTAHKWGQIFNISHKSTTPDNFSDYVNNVTPVVLTQSRRVIANNFAATEIGSSTSVAIVISNDWSDGGHAGYPCTHDVVIGPGFIEDTGYMQVWECERLTIRDLYLGGVLTAAGSYAANIRSLVGNGDQRSWSNLTGLIDGLTINSAERGGLRVQNPERFAIRNVKIRDVNTSGSTDFAVQLTGLIERGAQLTVDGLDVDGSGDVSINGNSTTIAAWAPTTLYRRSQIVSNGGRYYRATSDSGTSAGSGGPTGITAEITDGDVTWEYLSEPFSVYWGLNNRLGADCTISFTGDAHKYTHGRKIPCQLGDLAATGTVSRPLFIAQRKCYVSLATAVVAATVGADGTNFRTIAIKSLTNLGVTTTSISSVNTAAGLTAYVPFDLGFAFLEAGAYLEPNDVIYAEISSSASGKALTGLMIQLNVLDC